MFDKLNFNNGIIGFALSLLALYVTVRVIRAAWTGGGF
jgi:hypothetical protein